MTVPVTITSERQGFFAYRDFSPELLERLASEFNWPNPFPISSSRTFST
jgi:hypothetical protein